MKLKKLQSVILIALLCLPTILLAQTAEEIIAKHIDAHGGADKWEKVDALKITGRFTAFSLEKDFTSYKTKCGKYYSDFHLGEQRVIEAFNGKCGWTIDPWQEIEYARKINAGETNVFMQKATFFTPFFKYKENGYKVEYIGKETVDGIEMYALKLTRENGKSEKWYFDTKTYLEYKCEAEWVDFARTLPSEMYFDDFRSVDGLIIPFFVERIFWQRDRITQIEKVEVNPDFDAKLLEMPKRKEISKLDFMAGNWDVKMEFMSRRGEYRETGTTESIISYAATNLLQEKMSYENYFPNTLNINYSYNPEAKNYRIAAFNEFTSAIDVFQGKMTDNVLIVEDTHISFDDTKKPTRTCKQFTYTKIDNNNFTVENKLSNDEGKTWNPQARFTYTRKTDRAISQK